MVCVAGGVGAHPAGVLTGMHASAPVMSLPAVVQKITSALVRAGIDYMLTGSFASAYYGAPRSTQDIDFVIDATPEQLQLFLQSLAIHQYYADLDTALDAHKRQSLFNVIDLDTGWKIDLITLKSRAFSQEEFSRRRLVKLQDIELFVASAEDVIIAKMEWSNLSQSQRQIEDVSALLRVRWDSLDHCYLGRWITELSLEKAWNEARRMADIPKQT